MEAQPQRWTAKREAEIILQILRQRTTIIDVAWQNDVTPSEVQKWIDTFLKAGEQGLKVRKANVQEQTEKEVKGLKAAIGDLYVENAILKKAKTQWGELCSDRILTLQGGLLEDGIKASARKICAVLGCNRSCVYYAGKPRRKRAAPLDSWLVDEVRTVIEEFPEYGTRRITAVLRRRHRIGFNRKCQRRREIAGFPSIMINRNQRFRSVIAPSFSMTQPSS